MTDYLVLTGRENDRNTVDHSWTISSTEGESVRAADPKKLKKIFTTLKCFARFDHPRMSEPIPSRQITEGCQPNNSSEKNMPWRENDNYGYRDGDHQKSDSRGGLEGKSEADDAARYGGFSARFSKPFKALEASIKPSLGAIISGADSASKVCGEFSLGLEVSADVVKELLDLQKALSKIVDVLDKLKFGPTNERPVDSLSVEVKLNGEVNLLPVARSLEGNLKISTSDGVSGNLDTDTAIGDKISVGGRISIEGCMTVKNRDRSSWDLIEIW